MTRNNSDHIQKIEVRAKALEHVTDFSTMLELGAGDNVMWDAIYKRRFASGISVEKNPVTAQRAREIRGGWQIVTGLAELYTATNPLPQFIDLDLWGSATKVLGIILSHQPPFAVVAYHHYFLKPALDPILRTFKAKTVYELITPLAAHHDMCVLSKEARFSGSNENGYIVIKQKSEDA